VKRQQTKRGPKPDILKIEGVNWKEAIKKSFEKKKPPEGWPKRSTKKREKSV
jgi:hypothetical protein